MAREPWREGFRTFSMTVRGRKPTPAEITGGMGEGVTLWDGSDGIEPVRVAPSRVGFMEPNDDEIDRFWDVSVIAKVEGAPPPASADDKVDLGVMAVETHVLTDAEIAADPVHEVVMDAVMEGFREEMDDHSWFNPPTKPQEDIVRRAGERLEQRRGHDIKKLTEGDA